MRGRRVSACVIALIVEVYRRVIVDHGVNRVIPADHESGWIDRNTRPGREQAAAPSFVVDMHPLKRTDDAPQIDKLPELRWSQRNWGVLCQRGAMEKLEDLPRLTFRS